VVAEVGGQRHTAYCCSGQPSHLRLQPATPHGTVATGNDLICNQNTRNFTGEYIGKNELRRQRNPTQYEKSNNGRRTPRSHATTVISIDRLNCAGCWHRTVRGLMARSATATVARGSNGRAHVTARRCLDTVADQLLLSLHSGYIVKFDRGTPRDLLLSFRGQKITI